jgi:hypothetical protein
MWTAANVGRMPTDRFDPQTESKKERKEKKNKRWMIVVDSRVRGCDSGDSRI